MNAFDLDPNFGLPLWQALVRYFRAYPPVVHGTQQLELPLRKERASSTAASPRHAADACAGKHRQGPLAQQERSEEGGVSHPVSSLLAQQSPCIYLDLERRLPHQPSP